MLFIVRLRIIKSSIRFSLLILEERCCSSPPHVCILIAINLLIKSINTSDRIPSNNDQFNRRQTHIKCNDDLYRIVVFRFHWNDCVTLYLFL